MARRRSSWCGSIKDAVAPAEFTRAYNNLLRLYQNVYKDNFKPELVKALDLKNKAVDELIRANLMRQEAKRIGLAVDDAEVRDAIAGPAGLSGGWPLQQTTVSARPAGQQDQSG